MSIRVQVCFLRTKGALSGPLEPVQPVAGMLYMVNQRHASNERRIVDALCFHPDAPHPQQVRRFLFDPVITDVALGVMRVRGAECIESAWHLQEWNIKF